jgi:hypothetical protein
VEDRRFAEEGDLVLGQSVMLEDKQESLGRSFHLSVTPDVHMAGTPTSLWDRCA